MNIKSAYERIKSIHKYLGIGYIRFVYYYILRRDTLLTIRIDDNKVDVRVSDLPFIAKLLENKWKVVQNSGRLITFQLPCDAIINCRTDTGYDFGHLVEIFLQKSYGSDFDNMNVIDIGASNGDSSIYFAKNGARRVIGIEPDRRSFELAVKNISASKVEDRVSILNKALGETDGNITLTVYEHNPNANSVDQNNMVNLEDTRHEETVESIRLRDVIDVFHGEEVHLLKMDCEGCEYSVLKNLDEGSYKKIENIIMEYHNGLQFLKDVLESNGFAVQVNNSNDKIGYIKARRAKL